MTNIVELAEEIAQKGHEGQLRRDKKTPYISHPLAVRDIALGWLDEYINSLNTNKTYLSLHLHFKFQTALQFFDIRELKELISILSVVHDVPEDADTKGFTIDYIISKLQEVKESRHSKYFFNSLKSALELLTHNKDESYLNYIVRAKQDILAVIIKVADIEHNISTRIGSNTAGEIKKDKIAIDKYELARYILLN